MAARVIEASRAQFTYSVPRQKSPQPHKKKAGTSSVTVTRTNGRHVTSLSSALVNMKQSEKQQTPD
jgi:hypothetical protein